MIWTTRPRSSCGALMAISAGTGPDIVLIHGVGLRAEACNAQIDALAKRYRVTAIDLPGHGESTHATDATTVSDYADAIRDAIPDQSLVVGHSFGAMIALELARIAPDHVQGVAALNAIKGRSAAAKQAVRARASKLDGQTNGDPEPTLIRWFGTVDTPARQACKRWLKDVDPLGYKAAYSVFANADGPTDAQLANLACPALFMTGADEQNSTPAMSTHMAHIAPKGRAMIIKGAAHMMPMTHPDIVISALFHLAEEVFT